MPIASFAPLNKCPNCDALFAEGAKPHCRGNEDCTWVKCECGKTIDRMDGRHFDHDYVPEIPPLDIPADLVAEWKKAQK